MSEFGRRARAAGLAMWFTLAAAGAALAAPTALELVFERPYLQNMQPGATLSYRFARTTGDKTLTPSFSDDIKLNIGTAGAAKSAMVDLFTGDRARTLGPLSMMGNPVIITMLEHDVGEMQKVLGGSPYYIRNRMRDALAAGGSVEPTKIDYDGRSVDGWKLTLMPFAKDAERVRMKDFADRSYVMTFSDDIPGGLYSIVTVVPKQGAEAPLLTEDLTLQSVDLEGKK